LFRVARKLVTAVCSCSPCRVDTAPGHMAPRRCSASGTGWPRRTPACRPRAFRPGSPCSCSTCTSCCRCSRRRARRCTPPSRRRRSRPSPASRPARPPATRNRDSPARRSLRSYYYTRVQIRVKRGSYASHVVEQPACPRNSKHRVRASLRDVPIGTLRPDPYGDASQHHARSNVGRRSAYMLQCRRRCSDRYTPRVPAGAHRPVRVR